MAYLGWEWSAAGCIGGAEDWSHAQVQRLQVFQGGQHTQELGSGSQAAWTCEILHAEAEK